MTLSNLEVVVHCFGTSVGSVFLLRFPIAPSGSGSSEIIYEINPPGNGCGTFNTSTVVTAGSNVIDLDNYYYFFNTDASDAQKFSEIRLSH